MCVDCRCGQNAPEPAAPRRLDLGERLLRRNDLRAAANRRRFRQAQLPVVNLLSAPGSGKTALLERLARDWPEARDPDSRGATLQGRGAPNARPPMAVIVGDLATDNDARRLWAAGLAAVQISTGQACHLEAGMVERGKADGLYINTSGLGPIESPRPIEPQAIRPGDRILVSGDLGRHGVAILAARHRLSLDPPIASDCAPLWPLVEQLLAAGVVPHCLRDLTRGGLASALAELAQASGLELAVEEGAIPLLEPVERTCELLGFDPLHLANEGRFVAFVAAADLAAAMAVLAPGGGAVIGRVRGDGGARGRVLLRTAYGSERLLLPTSGELLPRIC